MMRNVLSLFLVSMASAGLFAADNSTRSKVTAQVLNQNVAPADGTVLTVDEVVRTALAKNPAIQSANHTVAAERAKVPQASARST